MSRPFIISTEKVRDALSSLENLLTIVQKLTRLNVRSRIVYESNRYVIGYIYVENLASRYPLYIDEYDSKIIISEGYTYNISMKFLANSISSDGKNIMELLRNVDGEYSILILDTQHNVIRIITDRFSSLPYYYVLNRNNFVSSRIPIVCLLGLNNIEIDLNWIIERLCFGYPCTCTFVFNKIVKTPPASIVIIDLNKGCYKVFQWCSNYDIFYQDYYPERLVKFLFESCKNRINALKFFRNVRKITVRLSGGLDSRIVFSIIANVLREHYNDISLEAFTHKLSTTDDEEVKIALEVSKLYDVNHNVKIIRRRIENIENFRINYIRSILKLPSDHEVNPDTVEAYGTGGDKVLKPLGRLKEEVPKDRASAIRWILSRYGVLGVGEIGKILNMNSENVENIILRSLERFPEKDGRGILLRYLVEARLCNWLVDDSYTWYTWRMDLHLSIPYFEEALHLDPRYKDYFKLCKDILELIDKRLIKVRYYNIGCNLEDPLKFKVTISFLARSFKKIVRGQRGSVVPTEELRCILESKLTIFEDILKTVLDKFKIDYNHFKNILSKYVEKASRSTPDYLRGSNILDTFCIVGTYIKLLELLRR